MFEGSKEPFTFNGVHLTDRGYQRLAPKFLEAFTVKTASLRETVNPALMAEITEKNFQYFHRYRAVNGFYIYGGRSERPNGNPPYTDKYVLENERAKLDEMCAIVDKRIHAAAQGNPPTAEVDYSGTRKLYDVPTNFKQPIQILPPEEAIKKFTGKEQYQVCSTPVTVVTTNRERIFLVLVDTVAMN